MVGFDSIILPGREGNVTSTVNIEAYRGGPFKKSLTVTSDAANTPSLTLYLGATIKPIIAVDPVMVTIKAGVSRDSNPVVTLRTDKADLKISDVLLKTPQGGGGTQWQSALPIYLDFSAARKEKPDSTGAYEYTVKIGMKGKGSSVRSGELELVTNHPGKKTVTTRITILE